MRSKPTTSRTLSEAIELKNTTTTSRLFVSAASSTICWPRSVSTLSMSYTVALSNKTYLRRYRTTPVRHRRENRATLDYGVVYDVQSGWLVVDLGIWVWDLGTWWMRCSKVMKANVDRDIYMYVAKEFYFITKWCRLWSFGKNVSCCMPISEAAKVAVLTIMSYSDAIIDIPPPPRSAARSSEPRKMFFDWTTIRQQTSDS